MKIVYFNYLYDTDQDCVGASVHVNEFVSAMKAQGYEIKSYNLNPAPVALNGKLSMKGRARAWLKRWLRKYVGQLNQFLRNGRLFFREWKILSGEKPDLLLMRYNLLNFSAALAAKLKGIPLVLEVNSPHAWERKKLVGDMWQLPAIPFLTERLVLRLADRVITVSEALKRYYSEKKVPSDKIFVIPNGVDPSVFRPNANHLDVRKHYGLENEIVLGFVGSFHYWHGVDNLLKLMERLLSKRWDLAFLMVGDGPRRQSAEERAKANGWQERVIFTGYVPHEEVPSYVAAMDIALAPYPYMPFFYFSPLKLYEYMAAGKPVVASKIGQIAEIIEDGRNGFLYEPRNFEQLVQKTLTLIENPDLRRVLGRRAAETIRTSYTWEKNAQRVGDVVEGLVRTNQMEVETT